MASSSNSRFTGAVVETGAVGSGGYGGSVGVVNGDSRVLPHPELKASDPSALVSHWRLDLDPQLRKRGRERSTPRGW